MFSSYITVLVTPVEIVRFERPLILLTDEELSDSMANTEEEIESKGGFETLGRMTQEKYQLEIDFKLKEMAYRN